MKIFKFDIFEQALPRESSVKQMKKLRKLAGKDIGDKTTKKKRKTANFIKANNPLDKKVDTYEKFVKNKK